MEQQQRGQNGEHHVNKLSIVMFLLLCVAIIIIVLIVYFKSQNVDIKSFKVKDFVKDKFRISSQEKNSEVITEFKNDLKEHTTFSVFKDNIIKCSKDSIIWLSKYGEEQRIKAISTENPVIKTAGAFTLIADLGGKEFYIINGMNIKWSKKIDTIIINADIDNNGFVSIVKEKKGYKGAIDIFDTNGNLVFTTVRSENFVLAAKVFSSENKILINKVDTSGINANTYLEFVNMRAEQVNKSIQEENAIFPSLWNLNGEYILGVSDNSLVCYNKKLERKWKKNYEQIYSSNIALGKYSIIAAESKDKSDIEEKYVDQIKVINMKGEDVASYDLNMRAINIECSGNIIAVNLGAEVDFINTNGKLISKYKSKSEILKVIFFNRQEVMLQTQNSIVVLKI